MVWLHEPRVDLLSDAARARIEAGDLLISPMVALELVFLHETGRIGFAGPEIVENLAGTIGLRICDLPFDRVVSRAVEQSWTRDPFDRIIAGHAAAAMAPLITKDASIRANYASATW